MKTVLRKIREKIRPVYRKKADWLHALRVSRNSKKVAIKLGANQFVAESGGLLHDLGVAKFGRKSHHITGVKAAAIVLLSCGCPLKYIGPILGAIYSHRASERIPFQTQAAKCVAAADALDHFMHLEKTWVAQTTKRGASKAKAFKKVLEKLEKNWAKIDPGIRHLFNGTYEKAKKELTRLASIKRATRKNRL